MNGGFLAGAIISKLTLDTSKWSQSISQVKKDEATMKGMSERMSSGFRKAGMAMTIAGGLVVGSLGGMIKKYIEAGDEIDKMSKRTGFAATTLSELRYAADISGASLMDVEKGVKRMSKTIVDASEGMTTYLRAFKRIGVNVEELKKLKPEDQFLAIAQAIAKVEDPTIRAATAQDIFGRAGTKLLPLFQEGPKGLQALREQAHELGIVFDKDAAAGAAKLKDAGTALKASFQGLGISLAQQLVPALTKFVQNITNVVVKINEWAKAHPTLFNSITKVVTALGGMMAVLGPMLIILPKLVAGFGLMKTAVVTLTGPVGILTAALGALALGYLKVRDAQKKAQEASRTAAETEDALFAKLKKAADAAGLTEREFLRLRDAYHGNAAAMAMAIKRGEEGKKLQEALAKVGEEHAQTIEEQSSATDDFKKSLEAVMTPMEQVNQTQQTWLDYLKDTGIQTLKQKQDRIDELNSIISDLNKALKDGKISEEDYTAAVTKAKEEIEALSGATTTWGKVMEDFGIKTVSESKSEVDYLTTAFSMLQEKLKNGEISQDEYNKAVSELETRLSAATNEIVIMGGQLAILGQDFDALVPKARNFGDIAANMLPPATQTVTQFKDTVFQETPKVESQFTQVSQRIKDAWTMGLKDMLSGAKSFKDVLGSIWGTIKDQFFTLISQLISKWTLGFIGKIATGSGNLFGSIKSIFGGIGKMLTGSEGGGGSGGIFGKLGSSFLGTISKMAGPLGIGLLVGKIIGFKNITKTVQDVWKAVSKNVVDQIKNIGKVMNSVFGAVSDIIGGIGKAIGGIFKGIGKLFGGGGGKQKDVTYWLKLIWENTQNALNQLVGFFHAKLLHIIDVFHKIHNYTNGIKTISAAIRDKIAAIATNKFSQLYSAIANMTSAIVKALEKLHSALTKKGTIYVDMIRSAAVDAMTEKLTTRLSKLEQATAESSIKLGATIKPFMQPVSEFVKRMGRQPASAQGGAVLASPRLVMTHGTPSSPEYILQSKQLQRLLASAGQRQAKQEIKIINEVKLTGTIISDRDYARHRLIPEIINALDVNADETKRKIKRALGM